MNRAEYMRELAYLLQDVPDEEREEALQYYEDYFDDAGPEKETQVIAELGRPEKVAAIIREGARNGYESQDAEYTENGYRNERYRGPQYEIVPPEQVKRKQIGGKTEAGKDSGTSGEYEGKWSKEGNAGQGTGEEDTWGNRARSVFDELGQRLSEGVEEGRRRIEESRERRRQEEKRRQSFSGQAYEASGEEGPGPEGFDKKAGGPRQAYGGEYGPQNPPARRRRNPFLWLLMAIGFLFLCPFLLGAAALVFAFFLTVVCAVGGIALAVVIVAVALVVTGVILFGVGAAKLFLFPLAGMMFMGGGLILFGLGILAVWLSVMVCGRLIPGIIGLIANFFGFLGSRRRGGAAS